MSVLQSLLGRRPSRERPDLASWIEGALPALLVDGDEWGATFPSARVLRHETAGGPGLPFTDRDPRRLPAKDGDLRALVFADVLDKVIDVGFALDEGRRTLAPGGVLLVVQTIAPEDFEERAIWNAAARLRDARHAWTPSARQLSAMLTGMRLDITREASWEDAVDATKTNRPESAGLLAWMLDAAVARGATEVIRDGALVASRRAFLLRRS